MWRLLFGGAALLAGLLYFVVSPGTGPGEQASTASDDTRVEESSADSHRAVSATSTPRALRMRGEPVDGHAPTRGGSAGEPLERSMSAAFAAEARGDASVGRERESMIRGVLSDLVESEVGAATIGKLECREQHCLLQLGGEKEASLVEFVEALQDERGFLGKCEGMMLAKEADGVAVYLRFAKAAADGTSPSGAIPR